MQIIIHIGAPKTATSSLQKSLALVYPRFHFYDPRNLQPGDNLLKIFIDYSLGKFVNDRIKIFFDKIIQQRKYLNVEGLPEIFSSEYFFEGRSNHVPEFPNFYLSDKYSYRTPLIADYLNLISEQLCGKIHVRCLLGVREPKGWLCSKYAQSSAARINSSQSEFENLLYKFTLLENAHWMSFPTWKQSLESSIGKENVAVLEMNDIGVKEKFISVFSELKVSDYSIIETIFNNINSSPILNKRGISDNEWSTKYFYLRAFLEEKHRDLFRKSLPNFLRRPVNGLGLIFDPITRLTTSNRRSSTIHISEYSAILIKEYELNLINNIN